MARRFATAFSLLHLFVLTALAAPHTQDTGFLNRSIEVNNVLRRYVVYLPEGWNRQQTWPVILFCTGRESGDRKAWTRRRSGFPRRFGFIRSAGRLSW